MEVSSSAYHKVFEVVSMGVAFKFVLFYRSYTAYKIRSPCSNEVFYVFCNKALSSARVIHVRLASTYGIYEP